LPVLYHVHPTYWVFEEHPFWNQRCTAGPLGSGAFGRRWSEWAQLSWEVYVDATRHAAFQAGSAATASLNYELPLSFVHRVRALGGRLAADAAVASPLGNPCSFVALGAVCNPFCQITFPKSLLHMLRWNLQNHETQVLHGFMYLHPNGCVAVAQR
jgi:hypothetical protein